MKHKLFYTLGLLVLGLVARGASPANAQTTGPYYAWPSWDQTLPSSTRFIHVMPVQVCVEERDGSGRVICTQVAQAVLDRETGLVWEKSPSASINFWFGAQVHCTTLNRGNRKGWRLPTLQELASLVDGDPANTSSPRLPPGHPFISVQSFGYWSASTVAASTSDAWVVHFGNGDVVNGFKFIDNFVWCVRGGQGLDPL